MSNHEMYDNSQRAAMFKKDLSLEDTLNDINNLIEPLAKSRLKIPQKPIVLIMGTARSGSTLLLQYLSSLGVFSYPSNLIARFYKNPYIGIRIQQVLLEFDPLNQLGFKNIEKDGFNSNLGKTSGALAPNEFWYFWREYFKFENLNFLDKEELNLIDLNSFLKKLSSFEILTSKPLVMKGMMLNWNIPYLHSIYPKFIFINLKRNIVSNSQSLISARKKFYCDIHKWYSFKPLEYNDLKNRSPIEQVVGQVYFTQKAIKEGLKNIPDKNKIEITYENFCNNPDLLLNELKQKFNKLESNFELPNLNSNSFNINKTALTKEEEKKYNIALKKYD